MKETNDRNKGTPFTRNNRNSTEVECIFTETEEENCQLYVQ